MAYTTILTNKKDKAGIITLNRPDVRNAMTDEMYEEILDALKEFAKDKEIGAVIIKGSGASFCTGADIKEAQANSARNSVQKHDNYIKLFNFLRSLQQSPKPIIAAVHSHCLGGGFSLALFSDMIIASDDASFGYPEVTRGFFPAPMLSRILYQHIGAKKTFEFLAFGERVPATEAYRLGIVNKVVPADQLEKTAMEWAGKLAAMSPVAMRLGKESFYNGIEMSDDEIFGYSSVALSVVASSEDMKEAVTAMKEKRSPQWKNF